MVRISRPWRPLRAEDLPSSFEPPKNWNGRMVRVQYGPYRGRMGYPDAKGNIWVPTKPGESHGVPILMFNFRVDAVDTLTSTLTNS